MNSLTFRVIKCQIVYVAGVDIAYWNVDGKEYATCCIVVVNHDRVGREYWEISRK